MYFVLLSSRLESVIHADVKNRPCNLLLRQIPELVASPAKAVPARQNMRSTSNPPLGFRPNPNHDPASLDGIDF